MNTQYKMGKWLFLLLSILSLNSCKKELDKSPLNAFGSDKFWSSENDAMLALTGVYRSRMSVGSANNNVTDWWSYTGLIFLEFATDNAYDRRGENSPFHKLTNGTMTSTLVPVGEYWNSSYNKIALCEDFLANIGKVPMDETKKKRMIAEVRFLRACQYFYMSQFYGSVPLVTKLLTKEEANTLTKAPKQEIVDFVIKELTEATADLPRHKDIPKAETGRASKQAALSFLGRMQLAEGKYEDAANTYKTIIDFGDNIIDPDYAGIFLTAKENSNENIFSAQFVENDASNAMSLHMMPAIIGGFHLFCPLASIVEEYDFTDGTEFSYTSPLYDVTDPAKNRDPRLRYSVLINEQSFKSLPYITHPDSAKSPDQLGAGKQATQTGYGLRKYMDEALSGSLSNGGHNLPIIRYAEVLLSYLEAKLEAGHVIDQSLLDATINLVRGRSSVNMPPVTELDPTLLRDILREERRIETAFEGIRYWDLLRWKIADKVLKADFYGAPFLNTRKAIRKKGNVTDPYSRWYVTTRSFRMEDYLWPVPQREVNINPNLK